MICTQDEEIESLQAIFCKNGEFTTRKEADGLHVTVTIGSSPGNSSRMKGHSRETDAVSFFLVPEYPLVKPPKISIKCACLPADIVSAVRQQVEERAAALLGESMLLDLCSLTQELLEKGTKALQAAQQQTEHYDDTTHSGDSLTFLGNSQTKTESKSSSVSVKTLIDCSVGMNTAYPQSVTDRFSKTMFPECHMTDTQLQSQENVPNKYGQNFNKSETDSKVVTALLRLDHMRSQNNYIKLIKKWTAELALTGRLVFCRKLILVLLQGTSEAVKEYIVRNRTTNVDVDSRGRACKERLLTVLCEEPAKAHVRLSEFCVLELPTTESLQQLFQESAMEDLYVGYVSHLLGTSFAKKKLV